MFAAAAMSLSSFCVVSNALRLRFFKSKFRPAPCSGACPVEQPEPDDSNQINDKKGDEPTMEKKIQIEGMMCQHCVAHVEKALTALGGVSAAQADLEGKCATVTLSAPVSDEELKEAVTAAGYEVVGIQ